MKSEGIRCPHCNSGYSRVTHTYTRPTFRGRLVNRIRRRRVCRHCGLSFFTVEDYESNGDDPQPTPPAPEEKPSPQSPEGQNPYL